MQLIMNGHLIKVRVSLNLPLLYIKSQKLIKVISEVKSAAPSHYGGNIETYF